MNKIVDLHTHLYPENHEKYLSGFDNLLDYHYLAGEFYKSKFMLKDDILSFREKSIEERNEEIWDSLFLNKLNEQLSFSCLGVNKVLKVLTGRYCGGYSYSRIKNIYPNISFQSILDMTNISNVIATYDYLEEYQEDDLVLPSIRFNSFYDILNMKSNEYREDAVYYSFSCDSDELDSLTIHPTEFNSWNLFDNMKQPFWIMLGVKRGYVKYLGDGGDGIGKCEIEKLIKFANQYPNLRIPFSILDPSKIKEAIIASKIIPNLYFMGHWWFNSMPTQMKKINKFADELLGAENWLSYYSDARVAEQLIYKWANYKNETKKDFYSSNGRIWEEMFGIR